MSHGKPFQWGVSSLNYRGETQSGDKWVVTEFEGGALVALIDALGHGSQAALVAEIAARTLEQNARGTLTALIERCHADLRVTRGAAISAALFDWRLKTMTWLGVGNVEGIIVRTNSGTERHTTSLLVQGGVVGDRLPELQTSVFPLADDTTLIMATDGVRRDFADAPPVALEPQRFAQRILDMYAKRDDDATVLVFRCNGDL